MSKIKTIGINGRIKSGKDTVASIIQLLTWQQAIPQKDQVSDELLVKILNDKETLGMVNYLPETPWRIAKYSLLLKVIAGYLTGLKTEDFEKHEIKSNTFYNVTTGQIATREQLLGAYGVFPETVLIEEVQDSYPAGSWISIRVLLQDIGTQTVRARFPNMWVNAKWATHQENDHWLMTDTRFPNEASKILFKGGIVIRVSRPGHDDMSSTHESETGLDNWDFDEVLINDGDLLKLIATVRAFMIRRELLTDEQPKAKLAVIPARVPRESVA